MATLANDSPRVLSSEGQVRGAVPVVANDIVYAGAAVGLASGYGRPKAAGDTFAGIALERVDNTGGAAGDHNIPVLLDGVVRLDVVGASGVTDVGSVVYASDDDVFTLSPTGLTDIGRITRWISGTTCEVHIIADQYRHMDIT